MQPLQVYLLIVTILSIILQIHDYNTTAFNTNPKNTYIRNTWAMKSKVGRLQIGRQPEGYKAGPSCNNEHLQTTSHWRDGPQ